MARYTPWIINALKRATQIVDIHMFADQHSLSPSISSKKKHLVFFTQTTHGKNPQKWGRLLQGLRLAGCLLLRLLGRGGHGETHGLHGLQLFAFGGATSTFGTNSWEVVKMGYSKSNFVDQLQ